MRYLTEKEKEAILKDLQKAYQKASLEPDGFLDLELIPHLERVNSCEGIVTIQSCTGHKPSKKRNYTFDGYLWIRLNKEATDLFNKKLKLIVKSSLINQVTKMYSYYGEDRLEEIISINFRGHEKNSFYQSIEFITRFFEKLVSKKRR